MAGSPSAPRASRYPRASAPFSSPYSSSFVDMLSPDRNSERSHKEALAAAQAEHERIRAKANHVLWVHEQQEEHDELLEKTRIHTERLRIAEERQKMVHEHIEAEKKRIAAEEAERKEQQRLKELAAKKIPPLSPIQQQRQQPPQPQPQSISQQKAAPAPAAQSSATTTPGAASSVTESATQQQKPAQPASSTTAPAKSLFSATPTPSVTPSQAVPVETKPSQASAPVPAPAKQDPRRERALQIHKNLKELRKSVSTVQTAQNPALKSRVGDMRREIRKCVGQLSFNKANNTAITKKVADVLRAGLRNEVGSQMIDPSHFLFDQRQPVEGAVNNDALPSLFLFLINHLAKGVINQFITESSANTKTADPIGVMVAATFSDPSFQWRGKPLIDILIAKFYVVCPVLFGARGIEKTEQGRERVGWKRRGPNAWMPESEHYDRQMGLGAGFAAISLRDFSRSKKQNPYPMTHYWEAFAKIVNTMPADMSNTQCIVLKAMIDHYEQRFLQFYGTAAVAALRLALVDYPQSAKAAGLKDTAVESLVVHGKSLKAKVGLVLG